MIELSVYNQQGEETDKIELDEGVFGIDIKDHVVHEVFTALRANQRQAWAHSKDRTARSGGGSKPWQQKGTGRARHGSIRSPLWRKGGVTFGPNKERNFSKDVNRSKKRSAVKMCLTDKAEADLLFILEEFESSGKTKEVADLIDNLIDEDDKILFLSGEDSEELRRACSNIPNLQLQRAEDANVMDFLNNKYVITTQEGVEKIESRFN
ncbi:MAG: 50S ribosomal protein L4 [Candidatus Magasanikbacteria bacterium]